MTEHMRGGGASVAREEEDGRAEEARRVEDGMVFVRERSWSRVRIIGEHGAGWVFGEVGIGDFGDGAKWQLTLCTRVRIPRGAARKAG